VKEILTQSQLARFEKCYMVYQRKGGIGAAKKAFKKLDPDDAFTDKIQRAIFAQNIDRKKNPVARNFLPEFGPWLNAGRWDDPIASTGSESSESQLGNCKCGSKIQFALEGLCGACKSKQVRDNDRPRIAEILKAQGLLLPGDTREKLNEKCRKYLRENKRDVIYNLSATVKSENDPSI
jgi:hypothetical protein